jgi:hypothetical protein
MAAKTVSMRFISTAVLVASALCVASGLITKQLQGSSAIISMICFALRAAMARRIGFSEVPTDRMWIVLWLPIAMSIYALAGFLLGWGQTVSWAVIALAYIAGGRAENLRQMLGDGV